MILIMIRSVPSPPPALFGADLRTGRVAAVKATAGAEFQNL